MREEGIRELLSGSRLAAFLTVNRRGVQLPSWWAVTVGLKPAMDLWVGSDGIAALKSLASQYSLVWHVDTHFDRNDHTQLRAFPDDTFNTTRAAWTKDLSPGAEAHVFIARTRESLHDAVASGWYPLAVRGAVVEKSAADHHTFGKALGYPDCCAAFFARRNQWTSDNTYCAAFKATSGVPIKLANTLPRHSAFSLAPQIACSFDCDASATYGRQLLASLRDESPAYAAEIDRRLGTPMLCLSELRIFRFEGDADAGNSVTYSSVEAINPTRYDDPLLRLLTSGHRFTLDRNVVRVSRAGTTVGSYYARGDKYGPECPFTIQPV